VSERSAKSGEMVSRCRR